MMNLMVIIYDSLNFKIEQIIISTLDPNSYRPFLKNEFSKTFKDLFKITLLTNMTQIYDHDDKKYNFRPVVYVCDILKLVKCSLENNSN